MELKGEKSPLSSAHATQKQKLLRETFTDPHYRYEMTGLNLDIKEPITSMGIINICNLWILLRKIGIYLVGRKCRL